MRRRLIWGVALCGVLVAVDAAGLPRERAVVFEDLLKRPREASVATPKANPPPGTVVVVRALLSDNGDGDSWADTNETIEMRLVLYNRMGIDLTGLVARLSTDDPKIACIAETQIPVGDVADRETRTTAGAFRFLVGDVDRSDPSAPFSVVFEVALSADQFPALPAPEKIVLDLDLDAAGGSGPTTFFEGFEGGLGVFTAMALDEDLNPPDGDLGNFEGGLANSDGYRCQYNDPDWEGSNLPGSGHCFVTPNWAPDAFWFHVTDDRAFSGSRSLHWGAFVEGGGITTPIAQLEALRTTEPLALGLGRVCSVSRTTICESDLDCPVGEICGPVTPVLVIVHQISQMDHRRASGGPDGLRGVDRAIVYAQVVDDAGIPASEWIKLHPFRSAYDTMGNDVFSNCTFDPVDDGNTEEDFFDPGDPLRIYGPSSTCVPERTFVHQGDTVVFDPERIGDASDGPGLPGESGVGTWVEPRFDLQRFVGRRIRVRFLETGIKLNSSSLLWEDTLTDPDEPEDDGWFIDDVTVTDTLVEPATITADAKENLEIKADWDDDSFGATCDCAPDDGTTWGRVGEARDLRVEQIGGATTLSWNPPLELGGTAARYDVIASMQPDDFAAGGLCIASDIVDAPVASDPDSPAPGSTRFYLIRAEHVCGGGPLGLTSAGMPRVARDCP